MTWTRLFDSEEMACDSVRRVEVDGVALCVVRLESGSYHAIRDACTHHAIRLSRGELVGDNIECPAHASMFNVRTGAVTGLPATEPVATFAVTESNEGVHVNVSLQDQVAAGEHVDSDWGDA